MPELRRSTRASTIEATKRLSEPPTKKAKTGTKKTESKKEDAAGSIEKSEPQPKSAELEEGDDIPDLTLLDENEKEVSLKEAAKKSKYLVIFAYPKASTPGCTKQAAGFQRNYADLQALGTTVFGLSADSPKSQMSFVTKQGLKYPLLSDPSRKLITILGAKKSPSGIKRSHWIFVDGKLAIKKIQVSPDVSVESALKDVQRLKEENAGGKGENGRDSIDSKLTKQNEESK